MKSISRAIGGFFYFRLKIRFKKFIITLFSFFDRKMAYIFMDESGDLGFDFSKARTTKYFIITFLFVQEKKPVERVVRSIIRSLPKTMKKKHSGVLHCHDEVSSVRKKLLDKVNQLDDAKIMIIYLNKKKVYTKLQEEKIILYNYVTNILLDRIFGKKIIPTHEKIHFIASKRETNRFLNDNFKSYLHNTSLHNHKIPLHVEIKTPAEEKWLQVVDFLSRSLFRKYEYGDPSYANMIQSKIIEENHLF